MKIVLVYSFEGRFTGNPEFEYTYPDLNAVHKCLMFISQDSLEPQLDNALVECKRYGFTNIEELKGRKFNIDSLNTDSYRGFSGFYEEALSEGSSLVYYPNT